MTIGREETGPRVSLAASQLQGPKLAGFKSHIFHFLAGDLGQIWLHL